LGTEPAFSNSITLPDERTFDSNKAESEYRVLQGKIKEAIINTGSVIPNMSEASKSGLIINIEIPQKLDSISRTRDNEVQDSDSIPSLTVKIQLR
jgi:hypothetical protein